MRCSDAIMLGHGLKIHQFSTFLTFYDKKLFPEYGGKPCGCALGGALIACMTPEELAQVASREKDELEMIFEKFPWLKEYREYPIPQALESRFSKRCTVTGENIISAGFCHVVKGGMTIEQLVDWVRSVEPDCGTCNRFDCRCPREKISTADLDTTLSEDKTAIAGVTK